MTFHFIYEPEYYRLIPAVIIDARASIPVIKNQTGFVIKDYCDTQVALVTPTVITYKIETELGVLAGFFAIQVDTGNKTATLLMQQFRPAFKGMTVIQQQISNFISSNEWQQDFLFSNN